MPTVSYTILDDHEIQIPEYLGWMRNCSKNMKIKIPEECNVTSATLHVTVNDIVVYTATGPVHGTQLENGYLSQFISDQEVLTWEWPVVGEEKTVDVTHFFTPGVERTLYTCIGTHYWLGPVTLSVWVTVWIDFTYEGEPPKPPEEAPAGLPWYAWLGIGLASMAILSLAVAYILHRREIIVVGKG